MNIAKLTSFHLGCCRHTRTFAVQALVAGSFQSDSQRMRRNLLFVWLPLTAERKQYILNIPFWSSKNRQEPNRAKNLDCCWVLTLWTKAEGKQGYGASRSVAPDEDACKRFCNFCFGLSQNALRQRMWNAKAAEACDPAYFSAKLWHGCIRHQDTSGRVRRPGMCLLAASYCCSLESIWGSRWGGLSPAVKKPTGHSSCYTCSWCNSIFFGGGDLGTTIAFFSSQPLEIQPVSVSTYTRSWARIFKIGVPVSWMLCWLQALRLRCFLLSSLGSIDAIATYCDTLRLHSPNWPKMTQNACSPGFWSPISETSELLRQVTAITICLGMEA